MIDALKNFRDVWNVELTAAVDATQEISDRFDRAAAAYRHADHSAARRFRPVEQ